MWGSAGQPRQPAQPLLAAASAALPCSTGGAMAGTGAPGGGAGTNVRRGGRVRSCSSNKDAPAAWSMYVYGEAPDVCRAGGQPKGRGSESMVWPEHMGEDDSCVRRACRTVCATMRVGMHAGAHPARLLPVRQ